MCITTLQVEVEVDAVDKGGNFIGWLSIEGKNLSVMLVEEGLCKVLPQAERLAFGKSLFDSEEKAKEAKKNIWEVRMFEQYYSTVSNSPVLSGSRESYMLHVCKF